MSQLDRASLATDITNNVYTNTVKAIKGNTVKNRLLNVSDSSLNIIDDLNAPDGYLGVDINGRVDVSFITSALPSGLFLRDDGTWSAAGGGGGSFVPYTGATANLDMGAFGIKAGNVYANFNIDSEGIHAKGKNNLSDNTAFGRQVLINVTSGDYNTGYGAFTLASNTSGAFNTAVGNRALISNVSGQKNTAVGLNSGYSVTGNLNTNIGYISFNSAASGNNNTTIGAQAGSFLNSGSSLTSASSCTFIGYNTRSLANGQIKEIVIGSDGQGNGSNTVTIGTSSNTQNYLFGNLNVQSVKLGTTSTVGHVLTAVDTVGNLALQAPSSGLTFANIYALTTLGI